MVGELNQIHIAECGRKAFSICRADISMAEKLMHLQETVRSAMPDDRMFFPLSEDEMKDSLRNDIVLVAVPVVDDRRICCTPDMEVGLAAFAVLVVNRESEDRNLAYDAGLDPLKTVTFDAVAVSPDYRGFGLHGIFITCSVELAAQLGADRVLTTVDPENTFSMANFLKKGFTVSVPELRKYGGLRRSLLSLTLQYEIPLK